RRPAPSFSAQVGSGLKLLARHADTKTNSFSWAGGLTASIPAATGVAERRTPAALLYPQEEDGHAGNARMASGRHRKRCLGGYWSGRAADNCRFALFWVVVQQPTLHPAGDGHDL